MDKGEECINQSENVDSSLELNAGIFMKEHHSLDEESLAGGSKGAELDETLRGYKSEDETMSRGYYTSKFDRISQSASTSTPKRQDKETPSQNENNGDFQILKDGLASPKTLERKREFAWQQFLVREKHKEELYKQFEAGKLKASLSETGDDVDKKPEVPLDGASQTTANDQAPRFDGIAEGGDNGVVTIQSFTRERQNLKSIPIVRSRDFNSNKPVKNKYQDPKVLTYPSSAQTSAQDCKRPIPTVADIEAMISSVKVGMDGNQNRGASTRFPALRREITYRASRSNKRPNDKPAMSARLHPAPSPIKMLPMPTYPPPPPPATYNIIPTLPIPSAAPTYSPRPLPLAPPDLTRPPPGFSFPLISNPVPPSNVYVPPPPSAFPVPILSQPPPTGDFNGGPNIYSLLSPPRSREICTPEGDRFEEKDERRNKVKKSKSGRRLLARSLSRDRSKGSGRSRSGERFRSRDKSISCERRTRSRSRERERSKQSRKRSRSEKIVKKKSTSRNENKLQPSTLSPEMDLTHTDSGNSGKAGKGTQALVKEYINDETGILEVFKGPGQQGAIVLFHINQLWILDKKLDQHGDPVRFKDVEHGGNVRVRDLVPVGQLVLANIRSVRSQFVDFQATVMWPCFLQQPPYTVNPGDLNDQLTAFHSANNLDTFLPLCIAGAEIQGSTRMWGAKIKEIIDDNWGMIEVSYTNKERNSNARPKLCLFNKEDVWLADGLHVANHDFFVDKPLADLVAVGQCVNMTARSVTKDNLKDESDESGVHMQALCVSLQVDVIPARAGAGTKLLGGPGTIGGSCNDQTPYMFESGLSKKLNKKLSKFFRETGRKYGHIDRRFLEVKVKEEVIELLENNNSTTESNKKIHKITDIEEMARLYQTKTGASLDLNSYETLEHMDCKEGIVIRILDDNFGIIQHEGFNVLFDTCDLWISSQFTAAKKLQKLQSVIKVGVRVVFHAALIEKSANIPYLASAVWPAEATFFNDPAKCPAPIRKECIHVDKIKIYEMVSETVKEPLPNISSLKGKKIDEKIEGNLPQRLSGKPPQSQHVHAFEGIIKIGFKLKNNPELFCGIVEFVGQDMKNEATEQIYYAFFLSKSALEEHEKLQIAVPKSRVFFNASQFKDLGPVSYLITTISKIHKVLPHEVISRTTDTVGEVKRILVNILAQNLPEIAQIKSSSYAILALETSTIEELIGPKLVADNVVNCNDGCRLVCMMNKDSGVLEDSSRNLCYFERSDLNLETDLVLHDLVVLFTRINLIKIRFQATEVEEVARLGPIKLVAHDKSVKISGDIGDRLPNVKKCASNYGKYEEDANRFSIDKVGRAKEAAIMFKLGNYLKPEFILDSPDFKPQYDVGKKKDMRKPIIRKSVLGEFKSRENIAVDNKQMKRPVGRMKSRSRSRERFYSSPQRIIRTSNKDGTFETRSQSHRQETLKKESTVRKNQMRRSSSEDASLKRKKKLISFVGKNSNLLTKESLSCCKILERYKGKVRSILNENFGLIEFYLDLKYPAFCLFDTCDLFIENDETAAQGKLTVGNVLSLDMEVSFNAVELQPAKAVPWLATAVWRTDGPVHKFPTVVEPQNIKEGKVDVYKRMAETCEVLVFNLLKPVGATDTEHREEEMVVLERRATDLVELEKRKARRRRPKNEEVETNPKFLEDRRRDLEVVKQMKAYKTYSRECPRDAREPRDPLTPDRFLIQSKTNWDESVKDWKLEIHAWYREQSKEYNEKRKRYIRDPDDQVKKKRRRSRSPESFCRSGHLPHKIYDHVTSGTLEHVVSELYAVVRLNSPPGAKAILHYDRVWVDDHQIFGGWRVLNYGWFQDLRINARRIHVDTLGIDYQVTFAHVGIRSYDPKRGVYNYTGRMAKFAEERMDTRELDRELDKCLDIMRK